MCFAMILVNNTILLDIVHLLVVDPTGIYSHGYIGAQSNKKHILAPRMYEADNKDRNLHILNTFVIKTWN
jgi:hypothetical protein